MFAGLESGDRVLFMVFEGEEVQYQVYLWVGEEFLRGGGAMGNIELFLAVFRN